MTLHNMVKIYTMKNFMCLSTITSLLSTKRNSYRIVKNFPNIVSNYRYLSNLPLRSTYANLPRIYIPITESNNEIQWNKGIVVPLTSSSTLHYLQTVLRLPFPTSAVSSTLIPNIRIFNPQYGEWNGYIVPYSSSTSTPSITVKNKTSSTFGISTIKHTNKSFTTNSTTSSIKWGIQLDTLLRLPEIQTTIPSLFNLSNPIQASNISQLWLSTPPIKSTRQEWLLNKSTELHMNQYYPLITIYSENMIYTPYSQSPQSSSILSSTVTNQLDYSYIQQIHKFSYFLYQFRTQVKKLLLNYKLFTESQLSSLYYGSYTYKQTNIGEKSYTWSIESSEQCERLTIPYLYSEGNTLAEFFLFILYHHHHQQQHTIPKSSPNNPLLVSFTIFQSWFSLLFNPLLLRGYNTIQNHKVLLPIFEKFEQNNHLREQFINDIFQIIQSLLSSNSSATKTSNSNPNIRWIMVIANEETVNNNPSNVYHQSSLSNTIFTMLTKHQQQSLTNNQYILCCGPEGGCHPIEKQFFTELQTYYQSPDTSSNSRSSPIEIVKLSNNILRTETAVLSGLSQLSSNRSDMNNK